MKVGDIIDGRKITRIYTLCGGTAYESVPVSDEETKAPKAPVEEPEEKPKKRIRRKKEQ